MDTVGDMLSRIRNAQLARHERVRVPFSNLRWRIAELLAKEGYVAKVQKHGRTKERRVIEIALKYENGSPVITELRRVSKPSRRVYAGRRALSPRKAGRRFIVSTPRGLMTDTEARKAGIGGEVLFEIW
jgi:small subunit ribosomal protein S8